MSLVLNLPLVRVMVESVAGPGMRAAQGEECAPEF
jgi:hypothetical protein